MKNYNVTNSFQLLQVITNMIKNPYEYSNCLIELNDVSLLNDCDLLHKIMSHSNDFWKIYYHYRLNDNIEESQYVIEPAYDQLRFVKLLCNRIKFISKPEDFCINTSSELFCNKNIIYCNIKNNLMQILNLLYNIFNNKLNKDINKYIFLFYVNKIMYVLSERPITSIGYFNNQTIKINGNLYKIGGV